MVILKVLTPFIFPENEMPAPVKTTFAPLSASAMGVPMNEFLKLTRIPIVIYYGDLDEEKTSTYMSGFIASTPPGQEVMPIMGWVCRLCAPSLLCTGEMPLPVVKVASIHLASPLRCKRIKRRTIRLQTLSLELTKLSGRRQPDDMSV